MEVRTKWDGEVLGEMPVEYTNIWTPTEVRFTDGKAFPDGVQAIYLTFRGNGSCSIRSFEFLHD